MEKKHSEFTRCRQVELPVKVAQIAANAERVVNRSMHYQHPGTPGA